MTLLEEAFEAWEVVTPKLEPYGTVMGYAADYNPEYSYLYQNNARFYTTNTSLNYYDILRRVKDGKIIRLISEQEIQKSKSGKTTFAVFCAQYYKNFELDE